MVQTTSPGVVLFSREGGREPSLSPSLSPSLPLPLSLSLSLSLPLTLSLSRYHFKQIVVKERWLLGTA